VVELGAGTGIPGCLAGMMGAAEVLLTDEDALVPLLCLNARENDRDGRYVGLLARLGNEVVGVYYVCIHGCVEWVMGAAEVLLTDEDALVPLLRLNARENDRDCR
jgi:hypothetical protein